MKNIPGTIIALAYLGIVTGIMALLLMVGWRLIEINDLADWIAASGDWQTAQAVRDDGTQYKFTAWNGITYTGNRYHVLKQIGGGNSIDEEYPPGEPFTIYYDRVHPEKSVADRSITLASILYLCLRISIWLLALYLVAHFFFMLWSDHVQIHIKKSPQEE